MDQMELRTLSTNNCTIAGRGGDGFRTRRDSVLQKRLIVGCIYLIVFVIAVGLLITPIIYNWSKINQFPSSSAGNKTYEKLPIADGWELG